MAENFTSGEWWKEYVLPYEPQAQYYSAAPFGGGATTDSPFGGGYAPAAQQYWAGQYGNVMNQYMGQIGQMMKGGQDPTTLNFQDYLDKYPWTQRYTALGPGMRPGGRTSRYAPTPQRFF